ncbi:helix-turn-helix domain-containing protein [Tissierella praeacuta]|uniref:helix-turn-helix domain-containing protein n=1 Tax=Tissierella praeacuta TaxID=43131 RepID=UPI0028AB42E3|nr:hypothetical protein [Tissierella praeacuta]
MVDVNLLREQLQEFVKSNGIKYKYIAEQLNISESMLCHWRKGRKELSRNTLEQLKILLGATV